MFDRMTTAAALAAMMGMAGAPAQAEEARPERDRDKGGHEVGEVVVTGSLIRGLPKEYVASPVFTHVQADIEHSGAGSLSEYMLTIPQNFTGDASEFATTGVAFGGNVGSALSYNQFDGFAGFSLRGLNSDATLTLLNGRRLPSAGMIEAPSVSFIPSALIERIEIIPDGASATYGADAVAGVVNLVTRRDFDGAEIRVRGSTATEVDRKEHQISLAGGRTWDSGSIYGMAMQQKRAAYAGDPVPVGGNFYEIAATPDEDLNGLYGGVSQQFGDVTVSVDGSYFESDRRAFQLTLPSNLRTFRTKSDGYSVYGAATWRVNDRTSFDLNLDYHRNQSASETRRRGVSQGVRNYENRLFVAEARGQTELMTLPAGPVLVAGGAQYREETLVTDATIFLNRNGGTREVASVFGEASLPLVSPSQAIAFVQSLTVSAAARYEDLGFDQQWAPKVGARWQVNDLLALRGTYSRSFLAPRLRDTAGIAEQVSFQAVDDAFLSVQDPRLPAGRSLVLFRAGANPDLTTQAARTFTAGFDLTPTPNLRVSASYYRVRIADRVMRPGIDDILHLDDLKVFTTRSPGAEVVRKVLENPAVFRRFVADVPFYANGDLVIFNSLADIPPSLIAGVGVIADIRMQNFAVERTDGVDIDLAYSTEVLGGRFDAHMTGQYIMSLKRTAGGGAAVSRFDSFAAPVDLKLNANLAWRRGVLGLGSVINYVDGFTDSRAGRNNRKIGSFTTASAFVSLDFDRGAGPAWLAGGSAQIVVSNIFDEQPPRIDGEVLTYDPYNNPPNPRTVSVILTKRF